MSNKEDFYSGFFLARLPGKHNGNNLIKVACFKAGTSFRKVLVLSTDQKCDHKYGAIVHFWPTEGDLQEKSFIEFKENSEEFYIHEETLTDRIVHTAKSFYVGAENLPSLSVYRQPDLGNIVDSGSLMMPGKYNFITFEVKLNDDDTFELELCGGQRLEDITEPIRTITLEEKFEKFPDIMQIEYEHNRNEETAKWGAVGNLRLLRYNDKDLLAGLRPVFELCDNTHLTLFKKQSDSSPVIMIKQIEEEDGKWKDDPSYEPQEATLFGVKDRANRCMARLKSEYRHQFEHIFKLNDVFRFESDCPMNHLTYWKEQKQNENEIFQDTVNENPQDLKMQDVLDDHSTDPEELRELVDGKTVKTGLNPTQLQAVKMALNENRKLVCIQGPPGTGKTYVLSILLCKLIKAGKQVIVLTPTKEALSNIKTMTERKLQEKRIAFPENGLMEVQTYNDLLNKSDIAQEGLQLMRQWRKQCEDKIITLEDLNERTSNLIRTAKLKGSEIMKDVRVVFSTIASSFITSVMKNKNFEPCMCIIDEAAQVMESQTWPAVFGMKRIIMAGDPKQLPALVMTAEAKAFELQHSVMDRIIAKKEFYSWIMLEEQYRCHKDIAHWSNQCFYGKNLKTNTDDKTVHDSFEPKPSKRFWKLFDPFVLVDTSLQTDKTLRQLTYEQAVLIDAAVNREKGGFSYANFGEAQIAMEHYKRLLSYGIKPEHIAIITPYKGQVDVLNKKMDELEQELNNPACKNTTIGTVDSVQGQEYDIVIFSMVRSNPRLTMGFVSDLRRLNVVITRAKRHFMFIGNAFLLFKSNHKEINKIYEIARDSGHRFHPNNVSGEEGYVPQPRGNDEEEVKNNYGKDLKDFIDYSEDTEMLAHCEKWVLKGKDPVYIAQRNAKKWAKLQSNETKNSKYGNRTHNAN